MEIASFSVLYISSFEQVIIQSAFEEWSEKKSFLKWVTHICFPE